MERSDPALSIGELSRRCGLPISALRFYAHRGVLPAWRVDPVTGYRWYTADQVVAGRLVVELRALGMPLSGIRSVLSGDRAQTGDAIDRHWRSLMRQLGARRRALRSVSSLLDALEVTMPATAHIPTLQLRTALRQVLPAVPAPSTDAAALPRAVLFEFGTNALRLVATDGHRLAIRELTGGTRGEPARALIPVGQLDRLSAMLGEMEQLAFTVDGASVWPEAPGRTRCSPLPLLQDAFPAYERLVGALPAGHSATLPAAPLRRALGRRQAPMIRLELERSRVTVAGTAIASDYAGPAMTIGMNPAFLRDAVSAVPSAELRLQVVGPVHALGIRGTTDDGSAPT